MEARTSTRLSTLTNWLLSPNIACIKHLLHTHFHQKTMYVLSIRCVNMAKSKFIHICTHYTTSVSYCSEHFVSKMSLYHPIRYIHKCNVSLFNVLATMTMGINTLLQAFTWKFLQSLNRYPLKARVSVARTLQNNVWCRSMFIVACDQTVLFIASKATVKLVNKPR